MVFVLVRTSAPVIKDGLAINVATSALLINGETIVSWTAFARMMPCAIPTLDHASAARGSLASSAMNDVRRINTATSARSCVAVRMEALAIT